MPHDCTLPQLVLIDPISGNQVQEFASFLGALSIDKARRANPRPSDAEVGSSKRGTAADEQILRLDFSVHYQALRQCMVSP